MKMMSRFTSSHDVPNLTSTMEQNSGDLFRNILATLLNVMEMDKG